MLQEIARVFSSNGVLLQGSEPVPAPNRRAPAAAGCDHKGPDCHCFGPQFDQASAKLELSRRGRDLQAADAASEPPDGTAPADAKPAAAGSAADGKPLSAEQEEQVRELKDRDRQVKAHEAAHQAAAGGQARGGAAFEYQTGPDGKSYAIGGHVDIEVSPVRGNPQATLQKAQTAQRAALAPADPSGQDRAVAAAAAQMAAQAQAEMAQGKAQDDGAKGAAVASNASGTEAAVENGHGGTAENVPGAGMAGRMRAYGRSSAAKASFSVYA